MASGDTDGGDYDDDVGDYGFSYYLDDGDDDYGLSHHRILRRLGDCTKSPNFENAVSSDTTIVQVRGTT